MLDTYLNKLNNPKLAESVNKTVSEFMNKLNSLEIKKTQNVLLLGNVQSGKTAQILGVISALAEQDRRLFLYLTTDSIDLQKQTLDRAKESLEKFMVFDENNDNNLDQIIKSQTPIIFIIKKNASVLKRWRNTFKSKDYLKGFSLTIIDDEADAASLNTNANKPEKDKSKINGLLSDIKNSFCQTLFIQLTATPQSLLLQNEQSNWKPEFIHYFEPGENYIGGKYVYSDPPNILITRFINEEIDEMIDDSGELSEGVRSALYSFLLTCSEFELCNKSNCNFAIHPSIKIRDHSAYSDKIRSHLNDLIQQLNNAESISENFKNTYQDLQKTRPDIHHFEEIYEKLCELLEEQRISIVVLNSKTEGDFDVKKGFNIIIGGNVIGRGLTIPKLQTVYYSRMAKKPNADTFWQHARIFGYDRDKSLLRLYTPLSSYRLFTTLNQANELLIEQVKQGKTTIEMLYPEKVNPTRKNVLHSDSINAIYGGVNYFPNKPNENNLENINKLVSVIKEKCQQENNDLYEIDHNILLAILDNLGSYQSDDWNKEKFISAIKALQSQRPTFKAYVLIKEDRKLSRGTGTMLSEDDRRLGERKSDALVLTLYQLTGETKLYWQGKAFWLPNIKFPHKGMVYWSNI